MVMRWWGPYVGGILRLFVTFFCHLRGRGDRDGQQRRPGFPGQAEGCCFNLSLGEVRPWKKENAIKKLQVGKGGLRWHDFFLEEHQRQYKHVLNALQFYFMSSALFVDVTFSLFCKNLTFSHRKLSFPGKITSEQDTPRKIWRLLPGQFDVEFDVEFNVEFDVEFKGQNETKEQWPGWRNGPSFPRFSSIFVLF